MNAESFCIRAPKLDSEPKQYHLSLDKESMENTCTLSVTVGVKKTSSVLCIAAELNGGEDGDTNWNEETKRNVEQIFQILHPYFVSSNGAPTSNDDYFSANNESLGDIASLDSKESILHRCLYALGKGECVEDMKNDTVRWKNLMCQTFTATDIIRNIARGSSGKLKRKVAGQLIACSASKALWKVLSKLGVAPSQEFTRLNQTKRGAINIVKGLIKDRHDLIMILYDNIGFRRKGTTPGFEQFTAIQLLRITKEMLQKWGIYKKKGCNDPPLSRKRKVWEEIRDGISFDDVMGISDDDNDRFASTVVTLISTLLDQESKGIIPSVAAARSLLYETENEKRKSIEWVTQISVDKGVRSVNEADGNASHVETHLSDVSEIDVDKFQTSLEKNNAIVDRPMKADLNSKSTVKSLMNYGLTIRKNILESDPEDDWWEENNTPIMEDIELPLLGDGSPTYAISTILRKDAEKMEYRGKVKGVGGGFHLLLEAHRKCGSLFGGSHLVDIFSSWRTTQGQLNWVLDPGDPGQIDAELVMVVLALYVSAIRGEAARKARDAESRGEVDFHLSPGNIIDSMVKRAMDEPLMLVMLTQLRLAELTFMLHEGEKKGSASIYITAKKYLAVLFATTHATKYVSMTMDFFVDYFCSSDAEKKIFEEAFLTRETKNGKKIFTDRFVEWMMKDLRSWLGKMASKNTDSLLERCALNLNILKRERQYGNAELNSSNKEDSQTQVLLDHIFLEVLIMADEANFFGDGPLKHVRKGPAKERMNEDGMLNFDEFLEDEKFTTICSTEKNPIHLNKEMLSLFNLGRDRLEEYYKEFLLDGDLDDPKRSETKVSLSAIDPLSSASNKKDLLDLERSTSTDTSKITTVYTVDDLKTEIGYLNQQHRSFRERNEDNTIGPFESVKADGNKHVLVSKVVLLRNDLIKLDPNWAKNRTRDIENQIKAREKNENESMKEKMKKELDNIIYTLDGADAKRESKKFTFTVNNYISSEDDNHGNDRAGEGNNPRTVTFAESDDDREQTTTRRAGDRESMGFGSQLGQMNGFDF